MNVCQDAKSVLTSSTFTNNLNYKFAALCQIMPNCDILALYRNSSLQAWAWPLIEKRQSHCRVCRPRSVIERTIHLFSVDRHNVWLQHGCMGESCGVSSWDIHVARTGWEEVWHDPYVISFVHRKRIESVGHPWRYDRWYWTKPVGNPAQGEDVIMALWFPLAGVVHRPLQTFPYHWIGQLSQPVSGA